MPSTVIRDFRYQPADKTLDIAFVSGLRYRYFGVPRTVYEQMRQAFSKGEFFNRHIRNHFSFERRSGHVRF